MTTVTELLQPVELDLETLLSDLLVDRCWSSDSSSRC